MTVLSRMRQLGSFMAAIGMSITAGTAYAESNVVPYSPDIGQEVRADELRPGTLICADDGSSIGNIGNVSGQFAIIRFTSGSAQVPLTAFHHELGCISIKVNSDQFTRVEQALQVQADKQH